MSRPPGATYANGSPYRPLPYPSARVRGCADGAHRARGTTDREGRRVFVCDRCPAWRYGDDPTWQAGAGDG